MRPNHRVKLNDFQWTSREPDQMFWLSWLRCNKPRACVVTFDLCDIILLSLMTHQVLHGREELFRKVCQSTEGRSDLRLSVWVTVDWQLLHRVNVLLQVRHVIWQREALLVQEVICVHVCLCAFVCTLSWCVFGFCSFLHLLQHQPITVQNLNTQENTVCESAEYACVCVEGWRGTNSPADSTHTQRTSFVLWQQAATFLCESHQSQSDREFTL